MNVDDLVRSVREDRDSGAVELAERAAACLETLVARSRAGDVDELRAEVAAVARNMLAGQPCMAPLMTLAATVLRAISGTAELPVARAAAGSALSVFRDRVRVAPKEVAARAEGLVPAGGHVLTLSYSSTVRAALLEAARRRSFEIVCLESRPRLEGRRLAADLAAAGLQVTLAPDAAVATLIRGCDVVMVGADAIGELGVVNKVGTRPAALAAKSNGIPVYALADTTKLLPPGYAPAGEPGHPADEVWPDPPSGVRIWNRYFEGTPISLFGGIVTEQGLRSPDEVETMRSRMELPAALRLPRNEGAAGTGPAAP